MSTLQQLKPHIVYRLVLAKTIFKKAIQFCDTPNDTFNFSQGLIALHDALDNFTGAIASQLNISLTRKSYLLDTLNAIEGYERKTDTSFSLISKNEIAQLNTIRNNIKHQGIVPNTNHAKGLIAPIVSFFQEYSRHYFGLEWEIISLADLIKDDSIKTQIKTVEDFIEQGKYKEALNEMAIIKFKVFEESLLRIRLNPRYDLSPPSEEDKKLRESSNIFPGQGRGWFSDLYDRADFLEKGIDRDLMRKFEDLTAKVGVNNNKEWKYILNHGHNWGPPNWTKENALFCYDFLVDVIIKNQRRSLNFTETWIWTIYTIQARDEIKIYDKDDNLIYTMPKAEKRDALIFGRIDKNWEVYNKGDLLIKLVEEDGKEEVIGYYEEGDKDKMEFLETKQYIRNDDGNLTLVNQASGG